MLLGVEEQWVGTAFTLSVLGALGVAQGEGVGFGFLCLLICSVLTEPAVNTGGGGERGQPDTIPSHHGAPWCDGREPGERDSSPDSTCHWWCDLG